MLTGTELQISLLCCLILMISVLLLMWRKIKLILILYLKEEPSKEYLLHFYYLYGSSDFGHCVLYVHWYFLEVGTFWHSFKNLGCILAVEYVIVLAFQKITFSFFFQKYLKIFFLSHRGYLDKVFIWIFLKILHFKMFFSPKAPVDLGELIVL